MAWKFLLHRKRWLKAVAAETRAWPGGQSRLSQPVMRARSWNLLLRKRRHCKAALKFLRKALRRHGSFEVIVTVRCRSYGAALPELGAAKRHKTGRWKNNRSENSHLPFRRQEMQRFRRMGRLQKFAAIHGCVSNHFDCERSLYSRPNFKLKRAAAFTEWRQLGRLKAEPSGGELDRHGLL